MFYERDTRDMYVYDEFEWTLWGRGVENSQTWVGLLDTPETIEIGKIPIGNESGDAIEWTDYIMPTGLEAIDEGNGVGWRLIGRDPLNYGNIGIDAVDFGFSSSAGTTGATGNNSFNTSLDGSAPSYGETSIGLFPTTYTPSSVNSFIGTDRLFNIGNGTSTGNRVDAFTVLKSGLVTTPHLSSALILAEPTGKAVLTKEVGISNETDSYVSNAKATNIITLTQAEFDGIGSPLPGTWYAIIG